MHFVDRFSGWVVGNNGGIVNTTDGGVTWAKQESGTTQNLRSVYFVDANYGWVVGWNGIIINTMNGRETWNSQESGTHLDVLDVQFVDHQIIDHNNGWVAGLRGRILHTTDGGDTWIQQSSGTSDVLTSAHFYDETTGWSVGLGGTILRYVDSRNAVEYKAQPQVIELYQNYPNPFNHVTVIAFTLRETHHITLTIYDLLGREVETILSETITPGSYAIPWNAQGFASGTYIYRLQAGNFVESRRLIFLK